MTDLLDGFVDSGNGLVRPTLQFTQWLNGAFKDRLIAADGVPDPAKHPMDAYRYLRGRRDVIEKAANQRPMLRLFDKNMDPIAQIAGERLASVEEMMSDSGSANVVLRYDNWLTEFVLQQTRIHEDLHLVVDPNPTKPTWETRWGGKVTGINAKRDSSGIHTLELEAISNRQHAKNLLFGANPIFPPEVQIPKMWVLPGNTRTILATSMFVNLARLFFPVLSIPANIFNPAGWVQGGLSGLDPLNWPLQVAFVNPLFDQSRTSVLGAAWTDWHSAMDDMLRDAGCLFRAYTWLTEDETSPHTELVDLVRGLGGLEETVDEISKPHRNCFKGTERFLTREGTKSFDETVGTEQMVLGHRGEWTSATIESFGQQEIYRVVVSRHGISKEILTTAGHRWFKSGRRGSGGHHRAKGTVELTTADLRPGDCLKTRFKVSHLQTVRPSAVGIQAGIVFGDGTREGSRWRNGSSVKLFGDKDAQLLKWFPLSPTRAGSLETGVAWTQINDLPGYFKDAPPLTESASYLYGWLAGYFAADGTVSASGEARIATNNKQHAQIVQDVCHVLGIRTGGIRESFNRNGFGRECIGYSVGLSVWDLDDDFFLVAEHRERAAARMARTERPIADWTVVSVAATGEVEEVYCAIVPDGQAFTLDGNILTGNCVVFALDDKSGITGPTGTAADGLINLIGATADDLITETLFPLDENHDGETDPVFRKLLGVAPEPPKTVWYDGQFSGIIESEHRQHKGPVRTVVTGGRSPTIVNQAITFGIRYALSQLATVINYGLGAYQQPGTEGLDNLYQEQLSNVLLAWMRFTDPIRALNTGDFAWQEHVERGGGTAYTLSGVVTLRIGNWKTRAWQGFTVTVVNGRPHAIDVDVSLGDRAGFEQGGIVYVDQISAVKRTWSRSEPVTVHLAVGDDLDKEDPAARGLRAIQAVWTTLGLFLGEGTLF